MLLGELQESNLNLLEKILGTMLLVRSFQFNFFGGGLSGWRERRGWDLNLFSRLLDRWIDLPIYHRQPCFVCNNTLELNSLIVTATTSDGVRSAQGTISLF